MDQSLITQLDKRIESLRDELASLTIRLVNIKSEQEAPLPGAPFGKGPKSVLDEMLQLGKQAGFSCIDYGVGIIGLALKEEKSSLGIWLHGDVVPAGADWNFDPYDAVEYQGCIIGRGATDNKGQLAAIFLLLRLFKELNIPFKYNPALYIGSNEETGMADLVGIPGNPDAKGFLNVAEPPRLSLVPDSGFPVGYGGKGSVTLTLKSRTPLHGCILTAGQPDDPGSILAAFDSAPGIGALPGCTVTGKQITAWTPPRHGAHPDPAGNMITVLSDAMLTSGLAHKEDRYIWEFLRRVSSDVDGIGLGIQTASEDMKPLTVFAKQINNADGHPELILNIRYPDSITPEEIIRRVTENAKLQGFVLTAGKPGIPAYRRAVDVPVVKMLCDVANGITGENAAPFTLGGGTYANFLPNAYVFGTNGNLPPANFPKGRGGAHGIDEAVSLDRLQRAMRIYARALLQLNELEW